ncbi:Smr/MutS family protein [Rhodovarius lipocyclicus]|uniref:Smr/MutS family protein n=1 Tax=Rhodovarius lipocyclicus TaxID=268410 RepID=UPI0013592C12|nr:Smr/MutS family protein [Rhodovarius lipocyclicus]
MRRPEPTPPRRAPKPRALSEDDRNLWAVFAQHIAPLPGRLRPALPPAPPAPTPAEPLPTAPAAPPRPRAPEPLAVGLPAPDIDRKRWRDLTRGRTRAERTLDLHGRFAQDAHALVHRFLLNALADGIRCVAIITGKGGPEGGILKRELPHWLNHPALRHHILAAAHPHQANTGSVTLLLRRARP